MKTPKIIDMSPSRFYAIADVMSSVSDETKEWLGGRSSHLKEVSQSAQETRDKLHRSVRSMDDEIRGALRTKRPTNIDEYEDAGRGLDHTAGHSTNFLRVAFEIVDAVNSIHAQLVETTRSLQPGPMCLFREEKSPVPKNHMDMQDMLGEMEMSMPSVIKFLDACNMIETEKIRLSKFLGGVEEVLRIYHRALMDRHTVQGVHIHRDPVITDIAMTVYENTDAHGEVADGADPDQVSSYTIKKAEILVNALKDDFTRGLIEYPDKLIDVVSSAFLVMNNHVDEVQKRLRPQLDRINEILDLEKVRLYYPLTTQLDDLKDVNPRTIAFRDKNTLMTSDERFNLDFKNKTLSVIVSMVTKPDTDMREIVDYVLKRKQELRKFFQEENSFYVCRISAGNPFLGEAPGALQVIPGTRPNARMSDILGSGFAEVIDFAGSIEASSEFHDLFVATSPSKTADKSNVLMVGPMGSGKSEVLRAVGSDKKSIAIFAQGSDFNTCWKGEMEKNPKRLFEQAVKLSKSSNRHVHICIDEIDAILNDDKEPGSTNLNLEFQILMDGVVHYPNLSVWGATNHVERIPMPMIRRFSKILVVGELSQDDRVELLKKFFSYMPWADIKDSDWSGWARKLDGATGDVMRKIADVVWRKKMTEFVRKSPEQARAVMKSINSDGKRFEVSNFGSAQRTLFKGSLAQFVRITPADVEESVRSNLRNIGVLSEITTARETYANAKKYLAHLANSV